MKQSLVFDILLLLSNFPGAWASKMTLHTTQRTSNVSQLIIVSFSLFCLPFAIQTAKDKLHKDGLAVASCTQQVSPFQPRERVSKHLLSDPLIPKNAGPRITCPFLHIRKSNGQGSAAGACGKGRP